MFKRSADLVVSLNSHEHKPFVHTTEYRRLQPLPFTICWHVCPLRNFVDRCLHTCEAACADPFVYLFTFSTSFYVQICLLTIACVGACSLLANDKCSRTSDGGKEGESERGGG